MIASLRQWIEGAKGKNVGNNADHKISQAYTMASIRIAICLLKPIVRSEESGGPYGMPACDGNWAQNVTVEYQNSESDIAHELLDPKLDFGEKNDTQNVDAYLNVASARLSASGNFQCDKLGASSVGDEFQLDNLDDDELLSLDEIDSDPELYFGEGGDSSQDALGPDIFSGTLDEKVEEYQCEKVQNSDAYFKCDKLGEIYELGLVFYELFSRGQRPPQQLASQADFGAKLNLDNEPNAIDKYGSRKKKGKTISSSGFPLENLRSKGLPSQLCDLIFNMTDCVNGDLRGHEAYGRFSDILFDLQLMLDKPQTYLTDIDTDNPKLQINEVMIGREKEYELLQSAYRRVESGSSELVLIRGAAGTGKSTLVRHLGQFIRCNNGVFLTSKFDQFSQSKPFSALAAAFDVFCSELATEQREKASKLAVKLQATWDPNDLHHLFRLIPNLSLIIPNSDSDNERSYQDCENAQKRLNYLFCCFVDDLTSCLDGPITLFLDDIHWADDSSVSAINQILKTSKINRKIFFVGAYRVDEMKARGSILKALEILADFGVITSKITLGCLGMHEVNMLISSMLCLPPRLVTSLSEIVYHKTAGNPLFIRELVQSLTREGLLQISMQRRRWVWQEEQIEERNLPEKVVSLFVDCIERLEYNVRNSLLVLSCFGASATTDTLSTIETSLNMVLIDPLEIAIREGLVAAGAGLFRFTHDRIQESAYSMIDETEKALYHKQYGLVLLDAALSSGDVDMLFTSINQINESDLDLYSAEERVEVSKYNLLAGKKSMELSDFSVAFHYFDEGMTFLPKNHWQDHYKLTLELHELAAKCSQIIGDTTSLSILSDVIMKYTTCIQDKLNIILINVSSLAYASRIAEAVERGLLILAQLGHTVPANVTDSKSRHSLLEMLNLLDGFADDDLVNYRPMVCNTKIMVMKFLAKLAFITAQVQPDLQPFVIVTMLQLTISHGICPGTALGFAYFSSSVSVMGNIEEGRRFQRLSRLLIQDPKFKEVAGEVIFVTTSLQTYLEPMQAVLPGYLEGESASMASGDIQMACVNRLIFCAVSFWSGLKLGSVRDAIVKACIFMKEQGHLTSLLYMKALELSVEMLSSEGACQPIDQMATIVVANKNPHQLVWFYFNKMFMSYLFNRYEDMNERAQQYFEVAAKPSWTLLQFNSAHAFYGALVSYRLLRETGNPLWAAKAKEFHSTIKLWSEQGSPWNFQHKVQLLDAEEYYRLGDHQEAQESYTHAIANAAAHNYIHDEALAAERAADYYFANGKKSAALDHYIHAHTKYCEWGAMAKADSMFETLKANLPELAKLAGK